METNRGERDKEKNREEQIARDDDREERLTAHMK